MLHDPTAEHSCARRVRRDCTRARDELGHRTREPCTRSLGRRTHLARLCLAVALAACAADGGGSGGSADWVWVGRSAGLADDDTLTAIDPRSGEAVRSLPVEGIGASLAVAPDGRLWAPDPGSDAVLGVDPRSGGVQRIELPAESRPAHVAFGAGALWVAGDGDGRVVRVDPSSGQVVATIQITNDESIDQPLRVAVGGGAVWVVDFFGRNDLHRIDPAVNQVTGTVEEIGDGPVAVAVGAGSVWVTSVHDGMLTRVDPTTLEIAARIGVGRMPLGVAYGAGAVWVATREHGAVARVDPVSNRLVALIRVGEEAAWVTVAGGSVWVTDPKGGVVARIEPSSNEVVATLPLEGRLLSVAAEGSGETRGEIETAAVQASGQSSGLPPLARELGFAGDACALLTEAEVAAAAGAPVRAHGRTTRWNASSCSYEKLDGAPALELQVSWTGGREEIQAARAGTGLAINMMERSLGSPDVNIDSIVRPGPVAGLGDAALYHDVMPSLVLAGDTLLHFVMFFLPDADRQFVPLARSALARLGGGS